MAKLNMQMPKFALSPVFNFISKRSGPFDGSVTLTRDRVYIVPTRAGIIFSILLFTLLIGSINYEKSLGFVLTFLLVGIGNIALLSTWRNIAGLKLKRISSSAVFAGETATFNVQLINQKFFNRHAIIISQLGVDHDIIDSPSNSKHTMCFKVESVSRGKLNAGRFRLYSEFPTGLFVAWTWVDLSMHCMVYPAPDKKLDIPMLDLSEDGDNDFSGHGVENFSQLRKYHAGDNINRISWKASAKSDALFTKEFVGSKPVTHWINWDDIPAQNTEHRLSMMTALIIEANKRQQYYGIKLPNKIVSPASGDKHFHHCLTELALY